MLIAIAVTFAQKSVVSYWEILVGMAVGGSFRAVAARRVKMTAMPQMVALFNGVGGGAAALISLARVSRSGSSDPGRLHGDISVSIMLSALIGSISFAGSMVAFAKLQELIQGRPIVYPGQQAVNAAAPRGRRRRGSGDRCRRRAAVADRGRDRSARCSSASSSCSRSAAPTCRS